MREDNLGSKGSFSPDDIWEMACLFQKSKILLTGYELGVFTSLGEKTKSSVEVAKAVRTEKRATDRLMNALCALGFLEKNENKFRNTSSSLNFLSKDSPFFMGGLMHIAHLWDSWGTLTSAVRRGKSPMAGHINERGKEWLTAFIAAMHELGLKRAKEVVSMLDLSGVSRALDVGGGSGAYSMVFVRAKKEITAFVFDLPNVLPLTRNYIRKEKLQNRVKIVVGDYNTDELGREFDLVFLSAIIHSNSPKQNQKLMRKCVNALNPGGQVVIQDFIMDEGRTSPPFGALFALNMLVATESGDTYTEREVKSWMEEANLEDIMRKDTQFGTTLIIGRKS